ncbi:isoleucine--tRNA ligase [Candidatus Uhrbacteria bacterium]|nr:isoleucine--tRNA ligase [Candidatus Uhrbacteria bacterium]
MPDAHSVSEREKKILDFWEEHAIFEKSVAVRDEHMPYVFYDGPPFATGLPHYGHIVASLLKDIIPRYWTMKGYRVERVWGWDCHGLPIENIIEEKLNLKTKKDIENFGIAAFNETCRAQVLEYAEEWKKTITRMGRWVDMNRPYMTMELSYMESVWWVFAQAWERGLIYEGKKAMHICPRCATALSNFEVTQGYKEITDITATVKFTLTNAEEILGITKPISILVWTTTPWTLPGNVLLAVGEKITYVMLEEKGAGDIVIIAQDQIEEYQDIISDRYEQHKRILKGKDLVGLTYKPLFPYFSGNLNSFRVVTADFVNTDEGTGVVHIAPAFGEDDYQLGSRENIPFVQYVGMDGKCTGDVTDFASQEVKPKEDPSKMDIEIIKWLAHHGALFSKKKYTHSYPHCWRCETPLLNYATSSWFVRVTQIKDDLLANNGKIAWVPEHMKEGRFGKWLENARDWAISRTRFWGTPLPIWRSEEGETICISSVEELEKLSGVSVSDLHKHMIDGIEIRKNGKVFHRIPEVLDCWFESGAMPYAQAHYPFENKEKFERGFPAEFIAEGQDQTRGWFYTLHVLATALSRGDKPSIPVPAGTVPAFLHVIVNGIVLAQDGKKMSKRLKNYPDPNYIFDQYGADALRFYLASSPVMHGENLNFSEHGVRETYNKIINTLKNVLQFYLLFAEKGDADTSTLTLATKRLPVLDQWILSRLSGCIEGVAKNLDTYHLVGATTFLSSFISDLSQWYVRRSRERCKSSDKDIATHARETLFLCLREISKLLAPFTPFIAEEIYQALEGKALLSVHLDFFPQANTFSREQNIEEDMATVRRIVEIGHALRAKSGIKVRQPLPALSVSFLLNDELQELLCEELNVKKIAVQDKPPVGQGWVSEMQGDGFVALHTDIPQELKQEGLVRELVRTINACRKEVGLTVKDHVRVVLSTKDENLKMIISQHKDSIAKATLATDITLDQTTDGKECTIEGARVACAFMT